jgi:hypothetical protein
MNEFGVPNVLLPAVIALEVGAGFAIAFGCTQRASGCSIEGRIARDAVGQAIVRAERLTTELTRTVDRLFAPFPLD